METRPVADADTDRHAQSGALFRSLSILALRPTSKRRTSSWGGEEFLILLPGTDLEGVFIAAEKVRAAVSETDVSFDGTTIRLTGE